MMNRRAAILLIIATLFSASTFAQGSTEVENSAQYRIGLEMDWKLFNVKGLKMSVAPELRYGGGFSYERFQVETALQYKTFGFLYWGAMYRLNFEPPTDDYSLASSYGRYALSLTAKERIGRVDASLRFMYSNYTDEDVDQTEYFRYRAKAKYNINHFPLDPYFVVELYQTLDESELHKVRYSTGVDYKLKKDRYINFNYKLDYFLQKYKNRHIFSVGYKLSF